MNAAPEATLYDYFVEMYELTGVRLEMVEGLPIWEAHPNYRHQETVFNVQASIRAGTDRGSGCECRHVSDV